MKRILHWSSGLLLSIVLVAGIALKFLPGVELDAVSKLNFAAIFALCWTLFCLPLKTPARRRRWLRVLFFYYLWILFSFLFFDSTFGRAAGARPRYSPEILFDLFRVGGIAEGVSMIPFHTIRSYLSAYEYGNISRELVILNLGGNLAAFAPMGLFLPALYRRQRNLFWFAGTVGGLILAVEVVQAVTGCGAADVDDFILNFVGACFVWLVLLWPTGKLFRSMERRKKT